MPTARDQIKQLAEAVLKPPLKERAFRKSGLIWRKEQNGLTKVMNVQQSQRGNRDRNRFTVNLGAYSSAIQECIGKAPLSGNINEFDCHLRSRVGALLNRGDVWWEVSARGATADVQQDFHSAMHQAVLPWLDSICNLESLYQVLAHSQTSPKLHVAAAAHLIGEDPTDYLQEAMSAAHDLAKARIRKWASNHGYQV